MKPNVHLTIERLVLHGFERVNRARLHDALTGELTRLLTQADVSQIRDAPTLNAETIRAAPDVPAEQLGVEIARAIYGGMKR